MYLLSITSTRAKWTSCDFFKAVAIAGWTWSVKVSGDAANFVWLGGSCLSGRVRINACVIWRVSACEQLGEPIYESNHRRSMLLTGAWPEPSFRFVLRKRETVNRSDRRNSPEAITQKQ